MKRLGIFLLLALFLQSKVGLAFNVHYCGAHIAKISWAFDAKGCGMEEQLPVSDTLEFNHKTCCDNDLVIAQDDIDQATSKIKELVVDQGKVALPLFIIEPKAHCAITFQMACRPPPLLALYKKNCAFLFYG